METNKNPLNGCVERFDVTAHSHLIIDFDNNDDVDVDLFEHPELLPLEVQGVIDKFSESENDYADCAKLVEELNDVGYTCDYGLDAEPYNLRKIL